MFGSARNEVAPPVHERLGDDAVPSCGGGSDASWASSPPLSDPRHSRPAPLVDDDVLRLPAPARAGRRRRSRPSRRWPGHPRAARAESSLRIALRRLLEPWYICSTIPASVSPPPTSWSCSVESGTTSRARRHHRHLRDVRLQARHGRRLAEPIRPPALHGAAAARGLAVQPRSARPATTPPMVLRRAPRAFLDRSRTPAPTRRAARAVAARARAVQLLLRGVRAGAPPQPPRGRAGAASRPSRRRTALREQELPRRFACAPRLESRQPRARARGASARQLLPSVRITAFASVVMRIASRRARAPCSYARARP